jgi:ankyrin repeat protein
MQPHSSFTIVDACQVTLVERRYRRVPIVEYLLGLGVDVNTPGEQGYTALHIAVKFNYPELVGLLLRAGARTDMITRDEKTARLIAR